MDPETRESLLARLPNHADSAAWEEFVQLYEPLIYGIGRRHGLQPMDASDLVQDVLIAVADSIGRFEPDEQRGRFRSWLFRVARNQALARLRTLRRQNQRTAGGDAESIVDVGQINALNSTSLDSEFDVAFRRRAFRWAARRVRQSVKEQTWEAFSKTAIECRTPQEVADELGVDVGTIYLARSRVMSRLKSIVQSVSGELEYGPLDSTGKDLDTTVGAFSDDGDEL